MLECTERGGLTWYYAHQVLTIGPSDVVSDRIIERRLAISCSVGVGDRDCSSHQRVYSQTDHANIVLVASVVHNRMATCRETLREKGRIVVVGRNQWERYKRFYRGLGHWDDEPC